MVFPSPTEKQARIFWLSLTALAIGVLLALLGLLAYGVGLLINRLSSVLLPLAIAAILAYLLDPVVDFLDRRGIERLRAIILVFLIGIGLVFLTLITVVPKIVTQSQELIQKLPDYTLQLRARILQWADEPPWGIHLPARLIDWLGGTNNPASTNTAFAVSPLTNLPSTNFLNRSELPRLTNIDLTLSSPTEPVAAPLEARPGWRPDFSQDFVTWVARSAPAMGAWFFIQLSKVVSGIGLLIGLALVPIYLFYFLLEKQRIQHSWADYLPIYESKAKEELVFILQSINTYLILFFRGQVLVALCDGIMLTVGFLLMGLNYAILIGFVAGLLTVIPYLGVTVSILPTIALAAVQFGDWWHPFLVIGVFALVQTIEGYLVYPKIMGDRVGLHPLTIIVAVMIGVTLMGGIVGGLLAIPLTAALRVLMFRYVWKKRTGAGRGRHSQSESGDS